MKKIPHFIPALPLFALLLAPAAAGEATYPMFRFTPLGLRDNGTDSVQLGEFELRYQGDAIDMFGAIVTNPDGDTPDNERVENVIDGNLGTKWLDFNKGGLVIEFPSAVTIDRYRLGTAGDAEDRDPVTWTLEGSEDGSNWILIDERTNYPVPFHRETYSPAILIPPVTTYVLTAVKGVEEAARSVTVRAVQGGATACRYVRFTPVKLNNTSTANSIQLGEFTFFLGTAPVSVSSVENPGGDFPENEGPDKLIDDDPSTKWLDFAKKGLVFDFGMTTTIDRYRLATANDYPDRDPLRWTLEASTDGTNWTLIENMTAFDFPIPEARKQFAQVIPLPGPSLQPLVPFAITANAFDFATARVSLTFRSRENQTYRVATSTDLLDWSEQIATGLDGADGTDTTTVDLDFTLAEKAFFRVEEE